jgi:hypothetical protein
VSVEAFGFDVSLAGETKATLLRMFGRVFLRRELGSAGRGEDPDFAVSENSVYIEQEQFYFLGPGFGHAEF